MSFSYLAIASLLAVAASAQTVVFRTDFEAGMPTQVAPGTAAIEPVQGFAGLGPAGQQFRGAFLRSATGNTVTLTVGNLPAHNAISLNFLFAAIDSLDGTDVFPAGDFFRVAVDGNTIFRESFANALPTQVQSYLPPPGVELARRQQLGFTTGSPVFFDSAYWLGNDRVFQHIGHTATTATITFVIEGAGIQPLADESWAVDELTIVVENATTPGSVMAYGSSCGPALTATSTPRVGGGLPLLLERLPANTVIASCLIGLSNQSFGAQPLPWSLDAFGATGCMLLQDAVGAFDLTNVSTAAVGTLAIPADPVFAGFRFFVQAWVAAPGSNAVGIQFSGGLDVNVGL